MLYVLIQVVEVQVDIRCLELSVQKIPVSSVNKHAAYLINHLTRAAHSSRLSYQ